MGIYIVTRPDGVVEVREQPDKPEGSKEVTREQADMVLNAVDNMMLMELVDSFPVALP